MFYAGQVLCSGMLPVLRDGYRRPLRRPTLFGCCGIWSGQGTMFCVWWGPPLGTVHAIIYLRSGYFSNGGWDFYREYNLYSQSDIIRKPKEFETDFPCFIG